MESINLRSTVYLKFVGFNTRYYRLQAYTYTSILHIMIINLINIQMGKDETLDSRVIHISTRRYVQLHGNMRI